ncbi:MAG: OsmC family protein [Ignavibacterium sp.]|jgi:uncharacterized OsmC-like protein|nr:OsmC family protein [Ignavibacterium sp.]
MKNMNIEALYDFEKSIYHNLSASQKSDSVSGSWNFENEVSQFKAHVKSENGNAIMLADNMTVLGGNGIQPSPMQYLLFGIASSFGSVLVRKAVVYNHDIKNLNVEVKAITNYDKFFGIDDRPPVDKLEITLDITTDQDKNKIRQLQKVAFDCCPVLFLINKEIDIDFILNLHRP